MYVPRILCLNLSIRICLLHNSFYAQAGAFLLPDLNRCAVGLDVFVLVYSLPHNAPPPPPALKVQNQIKKSFCPKQYGAQCIMQ